MAGEMAGSPDVVRPSSAAQSGEGRANNRIAIARSLKRQVDPDWNWSPILFRGEPRHEPAPADDEHPEPPRKALAAFGARRVRAPAAVNQISEDVALHRPASRGLSRLPHRD